MKLLDVYSKIGFTATSGRTKFTLEDRQGMEDKLDITKKELNKYLKDRFVSAMYESVSLKRV